MEKEEMLLGLANELVSCYGFIWKKEKTKGSFLKGIGTTTLSGLAFGPFGALVMACLEASDYADDVTKREKTCEEYIASSIARIISISKLIYPNMDDYNATLAAMLEVSVTLGERRIYNELVYRTSFRSNGFGGKVLVSDACVKVNPLIEAYFKGKNKGNNQSPVRGR